MSEPTLLTSILQYLGIATASITIMLSLFGINSIPFLRDWVSKIWGGITYPFKGASRRLEETAKKIEELDRKHAELNSKIDYIVEQLKPNSGSSLRDSLDRLESLQLIQENKMAHYLDSKKAVMFETTAEGLYTWVSRGYEELTGRSSAELRNWGWTLSISVEDVALVRSEWYVAIEQKRIFEKTYKVIDSRGNTVECYCRAVPTILNNKVIAWVGSLQPR